MSKPEYGANLCNAEIGQLKPPPVCWKSEIENMVYQTAKMKKPCMVAMVFCRLHNNLNYL